jgi:hypothetical protein
MEDKNLNQYQGEKETELKIGTTRDGRSIIFRVPGFERPFFKPVAYMEKVIESAKKRQASAAVGIETIKS